jgi:predicted DCC family thiol-disulfide oxidoreductase YuxK
MSSLKASNIIFFDGICNLCNWAVVFLVKHDKKGIFKFAAQQSEIGMSLLSKHNLSTSNLDSIIFQQGEIVYFKSDAIIQICNLLIGWPRIFKVLKYLPKPFRDFLYTLVANNRYKIFGKRNECIIPDERIKSRFIG